MAAKKDKEEFEDPKASVEEVQEAITRMLLPGLDNKTFSSGKKGFFTQGKIVVAGERYQSMITVVKIEKK